MRWGDAMEAAAFGKTTERHTYVNYVHGAEDKKAIYG
jgi:hypothetical protein